MFPLIKSRGIPKENIYQENDILTTILITFSYNLRCYVLSDNFLLFIFLIFNLSKPLKT